MKTIAIINQKGGVGKTTTALTIGAFLKKEEKNVLFIDLDAQANLSYSLGATLNQKNVLEVLKNPSVIKEMIEKTEEGDLLKSSNLLAGIDSIIIETGKEYRLKEALEQVNEKYDYCIIDTPPSLGIATINVLTASDGVIIPSQADIYSLQGITQLYQTIQTIKKYCNSKLKIFGILITRFNKRSIIKREVAELLEETSKKMNTMVFKTKIRECTAIVESQAIKKNIFKYAPKSNISIDYQEFINELKKEV